MSIDCRMAVQRMLEAEPGDLAGHGDSELAVHVRGCERCSAVAARLLEGQAELGRMLDAMDPRTDIDEALARARRVRRRTRQRSAWRVALPVAVAAALAGIVFLRPTPVQQLPGSDVQVVERWEAREFVEPQTNRNVLVYETRDRSAKVIWFY